MALVQDSKVDLVLALNRDSASALDGTGLQFSPVVPTTGGKVKIRLTALGTYTFKGTKVIEYQRRDLADLPGKFPVQPRMEPKATLYELLTSIRDAGVSFTTADLVDAPVTARGDGKFEVVLTAKPASIAWYGTGTFIFQNLPPITLAIKDTSLPWS